MATLLDRRAAVAALLRDAGDTLVVTGLGSPSYDVHAAGDRAETYYLWGAMGSAALVGLGLAQAQPGRRVLVLTGDGEQLMGLGGLATIAVAAPANLAIVIIDNGHFGETGMQTSHTGFGIALDRLAAACGFAAHSVVHDMAGAAQCQSVRDPLGTGHGQRRVNRNHRRDSARRGCGPGCRGRFRARPRPVRRPPVAAAGRSGSCAGGNPAAQRLGWPL